MKFYGIPFVPAKKENSSDNFTKFPSTFYLMVQFSALPLENDRAIQEYFRDEYKNGELKTGVAVVPGCAFSLDSKLKYIRFSCAVEWEDLKLAMNIIEKAIQRLAEKK